MDRRAPARSIGSIRVRIDGSDLPGRRCGPDPDGLWYENVHVGLARGTATDELVTYQIALHADRFEVTDSEGCLVTYRRA